MMPKKQKTAGGQSEGSSNKGRDSGMAGGANRTVNIHEDYEGYIMDLLNKLAVDLGFHYDLYLVPDNKFGVENTTTLEWNGMVREIIEKVSENHRAFRKHIYVFTYEFSFTSLWQDRKGLFFLNTG